MPNQVTAAGLETASQAELSAEFDAAFETIYGADINLEQDSPDGQMKMIFLQAVLDVLDLITQVYNGFDPDLAVGAVLDQRVAINGIQRQAGTFTITAVTITVTEALNLVGLDDDDVNPYTVEDNAGNKWQLQESYSFSGAGSQSLNFQSAVPGAVLTTPNTITVPVTIVVGVESVNNPTTYITLGLNEETDAALKVRRSKSVSLASQGYLAGLLAALENINGVTSAFVYENTTGTTDGDGVPGHSIWVIVGGSGADEDIAEAIYTKRNAGCGMFGGESYNITQVDGTIFTVYWDEVEQEDVWIKFDAQSLNGIDPPDTARILAELPELLVPGVNEQLNANMLSTLVQEIDPNTLVLNAEFSYTELGVYSAALSPSAKNKQFVLDAARIDITVV